MIPQYRLCEYGKDRTKALFWFFYQLDNFLCYLVEDINTGGIRGLLVDSDLHFLDTNEFIPNIEIED
jgi:hypothetical protein